MANHPMQATGGDMMRLVMIAATEAGIQVCCSIHDGFLILAPLAQLEHDVQCMETIMKATGKALSGVDVLVGKPEIVRWPHRFIPENRKHSHEMFRLILRELKRLAGGDFSFDGAPTNAPTNAPTGASTEVPTE